MPKKGKKKGKKDYPFVWPSDEECVILSLLWEHGPATVGELHKRLAAPPWKKKVVYTTVLYRLQSMLRKKLVTREEVPSPAGKRKRGKTAHLYFPRDEWEVTGALVTDLIEKTFRGSIVNFMEGVLRECLLSPQEIEEIKRALGGKKESE